MDQIPKDKKKAGDIAHEVGRAVISLVPGAGGPLAGLRFAH